VNKFFVDDEYPTAFVPTSDTSELLELNLVNEMLAEYLRKPPTHNLDSTNKFSIEFITGYRGKEKNYIKISGIINCIVFLEKLIDYLQSKTNNISEFNNSLYYTQQILIYDMLCKCETP
jgi:hypothetical protein